MVKGRDYFLGVDIKKATAWLQKAAQAGSVVAQYDLGLAYFAGVGVKADPQQGLVWIKKAADQNLALAQYTLGLLYKTSKEGVPRDKEKARHWLKKAYENNHPHAESCLEGCLLSKGDY